MKILFAARHSGYLPRFATSLRELSARGHEVVIALGIRGKRGIAVADGLAAELDALDRISVVDGVEPRNRERDLGSALRGWMDHLRYLEPPFNMPESPLHFRIARLLPAALVDADLASTRADSGYPARQRAMLAEIEARLPTPADTLRFVERVAPDVVVVTPLIERRQPQLAYLRAARELGIPRGVAIASWDNMTTSTLLHDVPDRVLVWNEAQRREAVELMGVPAERVVVTGAPGFDHWFGRAPSRDRAAFAAAAGLPDDRPYILYLGSSGFLAPDEAQFVVRWLGRIRASAIPRLRDANVILRSHPFNPLDGDRRLTRLLATDDRVVLHPDKPTTVASDETRDDYFDALHHAAAVVGINTSGLIEATILGSAVAVPLARRFAWSQTGSPHFAHLLREGDGLFEPLPLPKHLAALSKLLSGDAPDDERRTRFVESFVRPFGRDRAAAPLVADAVEALADVDVEPHPPGELPDAATLAALEPALARGPGWGGRTAAGRVPAPDQPSIVHVREPLVLIGQVQRCGGTLLNSLFDGHPMLHAHPHELHIGHPRKDVWPELDLTASAQEWLEVLSERRLQRLFDNGYTKAHDEWHEAALPGYAPLPFTLPPATLASVFLELAEETPPRAPRHVLDLYFSAYFSAWLDGPSRNSASARWVTGFCPRLGWAPSRSAFFEDYADGRLIMLVREPRAWYASAYAHVEHGRNFSHEYSDFETALATWSHNTDETEAAKRERPGQVFVMTYEALVTRTEDAMRTLAAWLGIDWDPVLLEPTFNRQPIGANSSFEPLPAGVRREGLERWRSALAPGVAAEIEARASGRYEQLCAHVADVA